MRKDVEILLLSAIASAIISTHTSTSNVVCINSNSRINKLYCDGVDYTSQLASRMDVNHCDCIKMPVCKILAVKAKGSDNNQWSPSMLQVCQTSVTAVYQDWVCQSAPHVRGKQWITNPRVSSRWRQPTKRHGCPHCHAIKRLPCHSPCFWTPGPPAPSVACVRQQCGDECKGCHNTGPGKCDPGMCNFGEGVNALTGETHCNRRCRVDFLAWGLISLTGPTPTPTGYIKLTDVRTRSVDTFQANNDGYYRGVIDMTSCTFLWKEYLPWGNFLELHSLLREWSLNTSTPMQNNIYVAISVGYTRPPLTEIYRLGQGGCHKFQNPDDKYGRSFTDSMVVLGVQNGPTTVTFATHNYTVDNLISSC